MSVVKSAKPGIVDMLVAFGVQLVEWKLPAELFERRGGNPISHDDLIDFDRLLETEDWSTPSERPLTSSAAKPRPLHIA